MREVLSSTCTCACVCAAEEELGRAKVQPQCILTVLQILTHEGVDIAIRQAASVFFKNLVKAHWAPEDETAYTIPADTKTQVKDGLLSLFLFVPPKLQAQLSEAMSLIATHDFPEQWPNLLSELVGQLNTAASATPRDYAKVGGLLAIAHSITGRYRHEFKSDKLYAEIKTVLDAFQAPLLQLTQLAVSELPAATSAGKEACVPLLSTITTIATLFYDVRRSASSLRKLPNTNNPCPAWPHTVPRSACTVESLLNALPPPLCTPAAYCSRSTGVL